MTTPANEPAPARLRLLPDPGTRLVADGLVLVGGSPVRVLKLTRAGGRQVAGWFAGAPVPDSAAARMLARRLLDAGIAHPDCAGSSASGPVPSTGDITVVIPVRDRHAELARCLAGLRAAGATTDTGSPSVIVVDDASADPAAIAAIAAAHGARVIRRSLNGGPGAARNTGLAATTTELVAFLDSDCVPETGWLDRLRPHFADPAVGAVAPRIVPHQAGDSWLARYEGASSTLDMGARPSIVRPGARVSYVPGAALVVRRAAAGAGFADGMLVGEDVDFVWRLAAAGWRVRYEPSATMGHEHRVRLRPWFTRRADYGTSAAALEELHPGAVRPLYASWWTVGAWSAALSGRPLTAAALTAAATALLARRLSAITAEPWPLPTPRPPAPTGPAPTGPPAPAPSPHPASDNSKKRAATSMVPEIGGSNRQIATVSTPTDSGPETKRDNSKRRDAGEATPGAMGTGQPGSVAWRLSARLAGGGTLAAGRPIGSALSRTWWPVAVPAAIAVPRLRRPVAALILVPPLLDWADRRPPLDPVRYVAARLLDDVAYSVGVWQGCIRRRTIRPLLPVIGGKRTPSA